MAESANSSTSADVADVLPLRPAVRSRPLPSEAEVRAWVAAGIVRLREASGLSLEAWGERWGEAVGSKIGPELVRAWERPDGPKPPAHWLILGAMAAGTPLWEPFSGSLA